MLGTGPLIYKHWNYHLDMIFPINCIALRPDFIETLGCHFFTDSQFCDIHMELQISIIRIIDIGYSNHGYKTFSSLEQKAPEELTS